eukprot:PhF_6_TR4972/c0_g1_i1/m.7041
MIIGTEEQSMHRPTGIRRVGPLPATEYVHRGKLSKIVDIDHTKIYCDNSLHIESAARIMEQSKRSRFMEGFGEPPKMKGKLQSIRPQEVIASPREFPGVKDQEVREVKIRKFETGDSVFDKIMEHKGPIVPISCKRQLRQGEFFQKEMHTVVRPFDVEGFPGMGTVLTQNPTGIHCGVTHNGCKKKTQPAAPFSLHHRINKLPPIAQVG